MPVVAAAAGAIPEVAADAALLVDPDDAAALAAALAAAIADDDVRDRLVAAGRARLTAFSWARSAEAFAALYRDAAMERTLVITVLCGGVGAARFLAGLVQVVAPADITAVVNTGDDTVLHGLAISPDLDTVTYTLAGAIDPERGWGLGGETWAAMGALERYAAVRPATARRPPAPGSPSATATWPPTCTAPTAWPRARRCPP